MSDDAASRDRRLWTRVFKRRKPKRIITTPFDDPIVQACIDNGGHFWPEDAPEDEPATCTRCWFNPGWKAGKPRNEASIRPIRDDPQA